MYHTYYNKMPITGGGRRRKLIRTKRSKKVLTTNEVAKIAGKVYSQNTEKHYFDIDAVGLPAGWNGIVTNVSDVPQGDSDLQRTGDQLTLRSFQMKYTVRNEGEACVWRVIVFQYMGNQTANAPAPNDVLQNSVVGSRNITQSPYSKDQAGKQIRILYDKSGLCIGQPLSNAANRLAHHKTMIIKFPKKIIQYSGGAATPSKNSIHVLFCSDVDPLLQEPIFDYMTRIRFYP